MKLTCDFLPEFCKHWKKIVAELTSPNCLVELNHTVEWMTWLCYICVYAVKSWIKATACVQFLKFLMRPLFKCCFYSSAASIQVLLLFKCCFYSSAASIQVLLLFNCCFYSSAASIQVRLLFKCGFYSSAASIQVLLLFKCCFYSSAASIQVLLLFKCCFYSSAASIQVLLSCNFLSLQNPWKQSGTMYHALWKRNLTLWMSQNCYKM